MWLFTYAESINMKALLCTFLLMMGTACFGNTSDEEIQATTVSGDQVILHPNGRWEFVDSKKALEAAKVAKQYPENQGCPAGTQGGLFGLGRCIAPGDKDFNRGSLSGKGR